MSACAAHYAKSRIDLVNARSAFIDRHRGAIFEVSQNSSASLWLFGDSGYSQVIFSLSHTKEFADVLKEAKTLFPEADVWYMDNSSTGPITTIESVD